MFDFEACALAVAPFTAGTIVRVAFDDRGLAEVTGEGEDWQIEVRYIEDPARTSQYVTTGDCEWLAPGDLEIVRPAATLEAAA